MGYYNRPLRPGRSTALLQLSRLHGCGIHFNRLTDFSGSGWPVCTLTFIAFSTAPCCPSQRRGGAACRPGFRCEPVLGKWLGAAHASRAGGADVDYNLLWTFATIQLATECITSCGAGGASIRADHFGIRIGL